MGVNDREVYEEEQSEADFVRDMTVDNGKMHIVSMPDVRPGSLIFGALIEYHWYPPSNPTLNDQLDIRNRRWEDMTFSIVSFSKGRFSDAQSVAAHLGLRIADGVPALVTNNRHDPVVIQLEKEILRGKYFPGGVLPNGKNNTRMFTLESNARKKFETQLSRREIYLREGLLIDKFAEGIMLRPREAAQFIFGVGEFANEQKVRWVLAMTREDLVQLQGRRDY